MARVDNLPRPAITPLRLFLVVVFLVATAGCLVYLFGVPLRMLYWGGEQLLEVSSCWR